MSYPNTRKFPRSLAQAFPREHANPVEFYPSPRRRLARACICIGAFILIGLLAAKGL